MIKVPAVIDKDTPPIRLMHYSGSEGRPNRKIVLQQNSLQTVLQKLRGAQPKP